MDLIQAAQQRHSVRTYKKGGLEPGHLDQVRAWLSNLPRPPFSSMVRFMMLDRQDMGAGKIGTYGTIKGADLYLAGVVLESAPMALEDYAYILEYMILQCTTLGLGSCWLGAAFKRGQFSALLGLDPALIIPAVTPIGYPAKKMRLREAVTLRLMKARQRKPAEGLFFDGSFSKPLNLAESDHLPFDLVRLAPSAINRQPWRIVVDGSSCHFYCNKTKPVVAEAVDLQRLDMGIAMCHFDLGAKALDWQGTWLCEDPGLSHAPEMAYAFTFKR
jgi:hypothetical protein